MAGINNVKYPSAEFLVAIDPLNATPIDARIMFRSHADALVAAYSAVEVGTAGAKYYFGQTLTVVENGNVTLYVIEPVNPEDPSQHGRLKEVGSIPIGDDGSIVVGTNGKLSLKNFGKEYHKYVPADIIIEGDSYTYPDSMPSSNVVEGNFVKAGEQWYVYTEGAWTPAEREPVTQGYHEEEPTTGFDTGLIPQTSQDDEGNFIIEWYQPSTDTVQGQMSIITDLKKTVTSHTQTIATLTGGSEVPGSIEYKIATALNAYIDPEDPSKIDTLKELIDWAESHNLEVADYGTNIQNNTNAINKINTLLGTELPDGILATNVIDYITEVANSVKATVKSVTAGANGHIMVDSNDVKVYELPVSNTTTLGGVKPDGSTITVTVEGVASVRDGYVAEVANPLIQSAKSEVLESVNQKLSDEGYLTEEHIATSGNVSGSVEAASDGKVVSEKLLLESMNWKTQM